jgi:hypothetical protein
LKKGTGSERPFDLPDEFVPPRGACPLFQRAASLLAILILLAASAAQAHDTGFGHSRRTLLVTSAANQLTLEYRIALGADEALIEATQIDADGDGRVTAAERDAHFAEVARRLIAGLQLRTTDGKSLEPTFVRYALDNSLTQTFRFSVDSGSDVILLEDRNFAHKPGQVRIFAGQGVNVASTADADLSHVDRLSIKIQRGKPPQ